MRSISLAILLTFPALAQAQDEPPPSNWDEYQAAHSLVCVGPLEKLAKPEVKVHAGFEFTFSGSTAKVRRVNGSAVAGEVRLGVISGVKELDKATRTSLDEFFERFKAASVEGVLVGGDSAENELDLEEVLGYLAKSELPTYAVIGNWESRAPFNRAIRTVAKEHPNLVNMDLVRRLQAEAFELVSLGGYFDKAYVKSSGACLFTPEDAKGIAAIAKEASQPVVLLMHAPPRQKGKEAIDFVPGAGNVGNTDALAAITEARIPFGVHGHILEAGGRATDLAGRPLAPSKFHPALFLNPGGATALPWKMNDGKTSYGTAAILTIKGKTASYEILRAPRRESAEETLP
jgi:Icc-related predicted phosphoesterase